MFEFCAPTTELCGQNCLSFAIMLPTRSGAVSGAKVACTTMVYNVSYCSYLSLCATTVVAAVQEGGTMPSGSNLTSNWEFELFTLN